MANYKDVPRKNYRTLSIKLPLASMEIIDRITELGDFEGRSHAVREMLLPALKAGQVCMDTGKTWKATLEYLKGMSELNEHFDKIGATRREKQQGDLFVDLPTLDELT
jgi:Arc/MetJ-type ribon-helix-helix transcriptional regulator